MKIDLDFIIDTYKGWDREERARLIEINARRFAETRDGLTYSPIGLIDRKMGISILDFCE